MKKLSKREFIRQSMLCSGGLMCIGWANPLMLSGKASLGKHSREAMFYTVTPRGVQCGLCPNECTLRPGETGDCRNRVYHDEKLFSIGYGNPCSVHIDPIEKKPLLHFHPKSKTYSLAVAGCNFVCLNCQNWQISQSSPKETQNYDLLPEKLVKEAKSSQCLSIAYTYSEPVTFYEYVFESSRLAHQEGIKNVFVSNGYINTGPLEKLAPHLDAANIDLKSFSDDIYLRLSAGKLQPVLNTLRTLKDKGVWLEITNLIVPSWTDNPDMIKRMCDWLAGNGFEDTPLHFSRFHPAYKLTQLPMTSISTLIKSREIARNSGLKYVYVGNVPGKGFEDTLCPKCGKKIVVRKGFTIQEYHLEGKTCKFCKQEICGIWN